MVSGNYSVNAVFAGLVMTVRKIGIEKKDVPVAKTFFGTVKENFKAFLLHGVVTYAIIACSIFAFMYYFSLLGSSLAYGSMLTVYVLFSLILTSMMFYVPIMSVTYELKISDIYKNSFILTFGNILKNILAMLFFIAVSLGLYYGLPQQRSNAGDCNNSCGFILSLDSNLWCECHNSKGITGKCWFFYR